jgi:hypothetical protein
MDVNFNNGNVKNDNKTNNNYYVRAVRSYFATHTIRRASSFMPPTLRASSGRGFGKLSRVSQCF